VPEQRPYQAYAAIMATFAGGLAAAGVVARLLDREPEKATALDLAALSFATFKASRTIARDEVTSWIREPLVDDADGGLEQALAELVTCSRCVGTWVAAGLGSTQIIAPRFGRLLTWTLGAAGLNDFLQAGFATLTHKSNEIAERAG
jgi:hypothetical protein